MGKAQERRDAEEKKAKLKAEKDAKKAALKQARQAKKAAKAEAKAGPEDPGPPPEPRNAMGWTDEEQEKLDGALRTIKDGDVKERWTKIGATVGKSAKECAARFKEVRGHMLAVKEWEQKKAQFEELHKVRSAEERAEIQKKMKEAYDEALAEAQRSKEEAELVVVDIGGGVSRAEDADDAIDALAAKGIIATFAAPAAKRHRNAKDISVSNLAVTFHGSTLITDSELTLNWGNKYGFVGKNGSGKSTLMQVLGSRAVPIPASIDIFHLTHEYPPTDDTALDAVMNVDDQRGKIEQEIDALNDAMTSHTDDQKDEDVDEEKEDIDDITDRLNSLYDRLEQLDAATALTRASAILTGLGFSDAKKHQPTKSFSGGWRMRVALARALFIEPDLLLLDEPTNHLDMEAVVWLEDYLSKWSRMLFMVCHSQDFLNNVCTHIVHLDHHQKRLIYYRGNYDTFVETRRDAMTETMKRYQAEQADIAAMKEYVARFGHGTAKLARQGKSKEKLLQKKLASGLTEKPVEDERLKFKFPDPGPLPPPVLQVNSLTFGYPNCPDLYENVDFGLDLDSRVALVGPNGAGKSTLVKIINSELVPRAGQVRPHSHLRMSKFTQHFEDLLDFSMTPLDWFMQQYPDVPKEDARKWLGRYGTTGSVQQQFMSQLSDGQKAKVVFCKMAKENAHILLLDEPTNALDMEMIDSLADAIKSFQGGVVLVSHDMRLISQVAKEIWIVDKGVTRYDGDITKFKMDLRRQMHLDDHHNRVDTSKKKKNKGAVVVAPPNVPSSPSDDASLDPTPPSVPAAPSDPAAGVNPDPTPPPAPVGRYIPPALRRQMEEPALPIPQKGDGAW